MTLRSMSGDREYAWQPERWWRGGCAPGLLLAKHGRASRSQEGRGADEEEEHDEEGSEVEERGLASERGGRWWGPSSRIRSSSKG